MTKIFENLFAVGDNDSNDNDNNNSNGSNSSSKKNILHPDIISEQPPPPRKSSTSYAPGEFIQTSIRSGVVDELSSTILGETIDNTHNKLSIIVDNEEEEEMYNNPVISLTRGEQVNNDDDDDGNDNDYEGKKIEDVVGHQQQRPLQPPGTSSVIGNAQARNAFAVGIIRQIKAKLEGKDFDTNVKMSVKEQVSVILNRLH